MTVPLLLVLIALGFGTAGARWLQAASWPIQAPALGILAWQALTASAFLSLVLAGFTLAVPELPTADGPASFFHACSVALREHYATPGGAVIAVAGGIVAVSLVARLLHVVLRDAFAARRARARQSGVASLVGRWHAEPDVVVLRHETPAVYCLPGRPRQVIVTEGALRVLTPDQLQQVLTHERTHIRARHHLALLGADALARVLFGRLGTGIARQQIAELAEMQADDAAAGSHPRELAEAVIALAGGGRPAGALGAAGGTTKYRVQRLAGPPLPISGRQRLSVLALIAFGLLAPVVVALTPALSAELLEYCPLLRS